MNLKVVIVFSWDFSFLVCSSMSWLEHWLHCYCIVTEIHSSESGLNTSNRCFQITVTPQVLEQQHSVSFSLVASLVVLFFLQLLSSRWSKDPYLAMPLISISFFWLFNKLYETCYSCSVNCFSNLLCSWVSASSFVLLGWRSRGVINPTRFITL